MESLDDFKRATAELADPIEIREQWLSDLGWVRPHGAYCSCMGCEPFAYQDDWYIVLGAADGLTRGFVGVAEAIRNGEAVWDCSGGIAISTDIHASRPLVGVA